MCLFCLCNGEEEENSSVFFFFFFGRNFNISLKLYVVCFKKIKYLVVGLFFCAIALFTVECHTSFNLKIQI